MARLQVGLPEIVGDVAKYATKFDMVELRPTAGAAPRASTLRGWRRATNPSFTFSVVLPSVVGELKMTKEMDAALEESLAVATTIEARCIVLSTPADVRPTQQTFSRLKAVVDRLPKPSVVLCWEPHGIWERAEIVQTARQLGVVPVVDAAQTAVAPGPVVYTRLRSLGGQAAIGERALARVAEQLVGRREAWVVVEHRPTAARVKAALAAALEREPQGGASPVIVRPAPGRLRAEDEEQ